MFVKNGAGWVKLSTLFQLQIEKEVQAKNQTKTIWSPELTAMSQNAVSFKHASPCNCINSFGQGC